MICLLFFMIGSIGVFGDEKDQKISQLQEELKAAKSKIGELEEELFIVTGGEELGDDEESASDLLDDAYPWTESMRRLPIGVLFPKTATIPEGKWFARFSHVAQNQTFSNNERAQGDPGDELFGLEDSIKIGILFGYGITKNWDVMVQRQNGRDFQKYVGEKEIFPGFWAPDYENKSYDLYDVMTKYKFLNEDDHGIDAALSVGTTIFWEDDDHKEFAGNAALLVEKSFWRFRVGTGLLYTSLSTYDGATSERGDHDPGHDARGKLYKNEGGPGLDRPPEHTTAIPVSLSVALNANHQLFGEMAYPIDGYETDKGPSMTAGWRYSTASHAYSIYLSNTANSSFNSAFTGGSFQENQLDLFGFDIAIFF